MTFSLIAENMIGDIEPTSVSAGGRVVIDEFGEWVGSIAGLQGEPGRDGIDGRDGAPGRDGVDGADGAPGRDGVDGADGASGRDGASGLVSLASWPRLRAG